MRADVYAGSTLAGTIEQGRGSSVFSYAEDFPGTRLRGRGIAVHLPLDGGPFEVPGTFQHPFFANLLPEGYRLQAVLGRLKASPDDALTLLLATAADAIGDVSVVREGARPEAPTETISSTNPADLDFEELLGRDVASRRTIPGMQEKVSDAMVSFPVRGVAGPCILKLDPPAYPLLVRNESFFMGAAQACGLLTAATTLLTDHQGKDGLLVRRFDRSPTGERRHQEDGCQLLNIYPGSKYHVSLREIAEAVAAHTDAAPRELRRLAQLVAFSYLIGNGDLHAKNVSIYTSESGLVELTPAYDLLSTLPYNLDQHMALKMDGRDMNLKRARFVVFFGRFGLSARLIAADLDRLCDDIQPWIERLDEIGYDEKSTDRMRSEIRSRLKDLAAS